MAPCAWKPEYAIAVPEVDEQHQRFFDIINRIEETVTARRGPEALSQNLTELMEYAGFHFYSEECLMLDAEYPDYVPHKAQHQAFSRTILNLAERFHAGEHSLAPAAFEFARDWLVHHILQSDQAIGAWLRASEPAGGSAA